LCRHIYEHSYGCMLIEYIYTEIYVYTEMYIYTEMHILQGTISVYIHYFYEYLVYFSKYEYVHDKVLRMHIDIYILIYKYMYVYKYIRICVCI
jgi:hypothetical protein